MSKPVRAAILVRISDDRAGDAAGVARQEQDARALADRLGWQVGEVIVENDVSAFKRRVAKLPDGSTALRVLRPGFRRLLELMSLGQVDGLVAYDLDRVARDPRDLEDLIDVVERTRVPVESVSGSLRLASDSDITMARVMVAVANKSSRDSSRRIARKHDQLAQEGRYGGGGARRYGFELDGVTHKPDEAEVIRWAAQRVLDGVTVSRLCRELDAEGVKPVKGEKWSSRALTGILKGPRVAGLRVHRGLVVGKAAWQPILDAETYSAVVATLHNRAKGAVQPELKRWLNGCLFCAKCGEPLVGAYAAGSTPYRYWCSTTRDGCGAIAVNGPGVEAEVTRQVVEYLSRPDVVERLAQASTQVGAQKVRAELELDEAQLKALARMWAERRITLGEYADARDIIAKRIEDSRAVVMSVVPERVRAVFVADDIATAWEGMNPTTRREVVQVLVQGWRVHPADLTKARRFQPERLEVLPREGGAA